MGELHVYREAKDEFEVIDNNNLPLAITDDTPYESMDFKVQKGDIITVFSDGVNEARNEKKDEYGFEFFLMS